MQLFLHGAYDLDLKMDIREGLKCRYIFLCGYNTKQTSDMCQLHRWQALCVVVQKV